jgi:hypothetical protein
MTRAYLKTFRPGGTPELLWLEPVEGMSRMFSALDDYHRRTIDRFLTWRLNAAGIEAAMIGKNAAPRWSRSLPCRITARIRYSFMVRNWQMVAHSAIDNGASSEDAHLLNCWEEPVAGLPTTVMANTISMALIAETAKILSMRDLSPNLRSPNVVTDPT